MSIYQPKFKQWVHSKESELYVRNKEFLVKRMRNPNNKIVDAHNWALRRRAEERKYKFTRRNFEEREWNVNCKQSEIVQKYCQIAFRRPVGGSTIWALTLWPVHSLSSSPAIILLCSRPVWRVYKACEKFCQENAFCVWLEFFEGAIL